MARTTRTRHGRLYWLGDEVQARVEGAARRAIDKTTEAAAEYARSHHPGWRTVTGTAEASIGTNPARLQGRRIRGNVTGGEGEAFYLLILEVKKGAALRNAGDVEFPKVQERLADEYQRGIG
jgi:hypothetical protein